MCERQGKEANSCGRARGGFRRADILQTFPPLRCPGDRRRSHQSSSVSAVALPVGHRPPVRRRHRRQIAGVQNHVVRVRPGDRGNDGGLRYSSAPRLLGRGERPEGPVFVWRNARGVRRAR